jgi:hypothetical protein
MTKAAYDDVFPDGGSSLVGCIVPLDGWVDVEPYDNLWTGADGKDNAHALHTIALENGTLEYYPDGESFILDLPNLFPGQVALVPDGTRVEDIWPGSPNDPWGRWLGYHPRCPNAHEPLPGHPPLYVSAPAREPEGP